MTTGWWAEIHERFRLTVSPSFGAKAELAPIDADFALSVDSGLQMDGSGTSGDSFGLSVSPSLDLDGSSRSRGFLDVSVSPTVGMAADEHFSRVLDLNIDPVLGVMGAESFRQMLDLSVSPHVAMDGVGRHGGQFGLSVSSSLGMNAASASTGDFRLAVSPTLSASAKTHHDSTFDMSVSPSLGVGAGTHEHGSFTVARVSLIRMNGKGKGPVLFNAVGGGGWSTASGSHSISWSHTASGEGRAVVVSVALRVGVTGGGNPVNISVTYGTTPMTALTSTGFNNQSVARTQQFILLNPPTGSQTVRVNISGSSSTGNANSVSYRQVNSYVQGASNYGIGISRSLTVTNARPRDMVVQAFGQYSDLEMTGYNQTSRSNRAPGGGAPALLIGDSAEGDNSISFTATTVASTPWSGVSVVLRSS